MSRTGLIAAGLPKGLQNKAFDSVAYTKNQLPHKALEGKTSIKMILAKDPVNERKNLHLFGQKVTFYNYEVKDKLSARSYKARIIGYIRKEFLASWRLAVAPWHPPFYCWLWCYWYLRSIRAPLSKIVGFWASKYQQFQPKLKRFWA